MTANAAEILHLAEDRSSRRWIGAAILVILAHAGVAYWLTHRHADDGAEAAAPAVLVELAPLEVTPPAETTAEVTPGPQMTEVEPEEVEPPEAMAVPELPPQPKPKAVLMAAPKPNPKPKPKKIVQEPPKPVVKKALEKPAPRTSAPIRSGAARAATTARDGASGAPSMSSSNWRSLVLARLNQHKPGAAHETGTVSLSFTINRGGHVVAASVSGSSGSATLDHAALAMVHSASPLPPPPPEIGGGSISLTVPVRFH